MTSRRQIVALCLLVALAHACTQQPPEELAWAEAGVAVSKQALFAAPFTANADTTLRSGAPFANDGTGSLLGVTAASVADVKRSIVQFSQAQIAGAIPAGNVLQSARLDLKVTGISAGWLGGAIDILPMNRSWVEGTGLAGNGASWVCANDTNTTLLGNLTNNCAAADNWGMLPTDPFPRPFSPEATDRVPLFTGGLTTISFDVTADVQRF